LFHLLALFLADLRPIHLLHIFRIGSNSFKEFPFFLCQFFFLQSLWILVDTSNLSNRHESLLLQFKVVFPLLVESLFPMLSTLFNVTLSDSLILHRMVLKLGLWYRFVEIADLFELLFLLLQLWQLNLLLIFLLIKFI
jgi:hypothetical protein